MKGTTNAKPPHVCILCSEHPPDDKRVTHRVGMSFRKAGFRVTWVGRKRERTGDDYGIDFRYYERSPGKRGRLLSSKGLYKLAEQVDDVDIWYAVEPDSAVVAILLARKKGGKNVFSIHENFHDEMLGRWVQGLAKKIMGILILNAIRILCRQVDLVVGVGITRLTMYTTDRTPKLVVRHCTPLEFAEGEPAAVLAPEKPVYRIMHGKSTCNHGTKTAIDAFAILQPSVPKKCSLRIFNVPSSGHHCFEGGLVSYARKAGTLDNLEISDQVPFRKMFEILRTCDVGLILYIKEWGVMCMPNRIFEYMAMGLPVVVPSYSIELKLIVEAEKCGLLVDTESPEAIAEALQYLFDHPEEAREMGRRGHQAFLDNLNWETEVQPLLEWIRKTAEVKTA